MVRQSFACALLLLAGRKAGIEVFVEDEERGDGGGDRNGNGDGNDKVDESLREALGTLRYWEDEACDLKASRMILEDVVQGLGEPI